MKKLEKNRKIPCDLIEDFPPARNEYEILKTKFCGLDFESPFILAASPCTDEISLLERAFDMGWAGAVLKTTSVEGTVVNLAYPMMSSLNYNESRVVGLGNIDLISKYDVREVSSRVSKLKNKYPEKIVIASIMGTRKEDWQELTKRLFDSGADMIECSFSCPQGSMGEEPGKMLAQSVAATEKVASWVKESAGSKPVSIKITPQVTDIVEIARALERAGVDCVTASNSVPALMGIDIENFTPVPSISGKSTYSGFTGPAIKPITLRTIAEIAKNTRLPVSGTGGISCWRDAVEVMSVGAGIVQLCTAVMHYGFRIIDDLKSGLTNYMLRKGMKSPSEIVGKALPNIVNHESLSRLKVRSSIRKSLCIGCGVCVVACRDGGHEAIGFSKKRIPVVDEEKCAGCGLCRVVCPVDGCIEMKII